MGGERRMRGRKRKKAGGHACTQSRRASARGGGAQSHGVTRDGRDAGRDVATSRASDAHGTPSCTRRPQLKLPLSPAVGALVHLCTLQTAPTPFVPVVDILGANHKPHPAEHVVGLQKRWRVGRCHHRDVAPAQTEEQRWRSNRGCSSTTFDPLVIHCAPVSPSDRLSAKYVRIERPRVNPFARPLVERPCTAPSASHTAEVPPARLPCTLEISVAAPVASAQDLGR